MTLGWLHVALMLAAPFALGAAGLRALGIGWRTDRLAFPCWAWIAGSLGVAAIELSWLWLRKPVPGTWLAPLAAVIAVGVWSACRRRPVAAPLPPARTPSKAGGIATAVVLLALSAYTADRCVQRMAEPVSFSDEADIWTAQAKVMALTGGLDAEFGAAARLHAFRPDYPPLNPLLQLWTFAAAGDVLYVENRFPIQVFAFALLVLLAAVLRRVTSPWLAVLLLVLVWSQAALRGFVGSVYADIMAACLLLAAFDAWLRWRANGAAAYAGLVGLALTALVLTKNEGSVQAIALGATLGLAAAIRRRDGPWFPRPLPWLALPLVAAFALRLYHRVLGFRTDLFENDLLGDQVETRSFTTRLFEQAADRIGPVLSRFADEELFAPERSRLLLLLFVVALIAHPRRLLRGELLVLAGLIVATTAAYFTVFLASPYGMDALLNSALDRIMFHLAPLLAVGIGLALPSLATGSESAASV